MTARVSIRDIRARKGKTPLVALTAYTAPMARLLDAEVDILLVGDSLGMVVYGLESTLPVTLDMMIAHGQGVMRGAAHACVIVDMPFGSYQSSPRDAYIAAARVMKETGCSGVKLEGGAEMADTIRYLAERAIPVMGHVGLMPQHVHALGGYRYQGRSEAEKKMLIADAKAVATAGAFAMVIEAVREETGAAITKAVDVPTIGIGASPACDGQVLVTEDMLGLSGMTPGFVKQYASLSPAVKKAASAYAKDVRARKFPSPAQLFKKP